MPWPRVVAGISPFAATDLDLTFARRSRQFPARDMQEISPLPDAGAELAIAPAEPLAPASVPRNGKWPVAFLASCLLHAAAAAFFLISPSGSSNLLDAPQSQGSDQSGEKVAGNALDRNPDAMNVTLVPSPKPVKQQQTKAATPTPPAQPARQATSQAPVPATDTPKPAPEPLPETARQSPARPDILVSATPRTDNQSVVVQPQTPNEPNAQTQVVEAPVAVPDRPPVPTARPTPPATSGADERSGTADGKDQAALATSTGKNRKETGSATEDSYRGDVFRKLGSVNRTLPPSLQLTARNNAIVAFVVGRKGTIDELRILESSGSAAFDKAALGIVRKAAPFPPIPAQAGRPSLEFELDIGPF